MGVAEKVNGMTPLEVLGEAWLRLSRRARRTIRPLTVKYSSPSISDAELDSHLNIGRRVDLLAYFKKRVYPRFCGGLAEIGRSSELLIELFPHTASQVVWEADEIEKRRFFIFGREYQLDGEIDWHRDFSTGARWPLEHYTRVPIIHRQAGADVKVPWELNRLQHFSALGIAYNVTQMEKYAEDFSRQLNSWAQSNPVEFGVNWTCAMEAALRAINLAMSFFLFRGSETFDEKLLRTLLKLLLEHGRFIRRNLEFSYRATSNHYLSDLAGLLFIGVLFPEFKQSRRWAQFALRELLREMDKQINEDGTDYEASISYHRFVLELLLHCFVLCKVNGIALPDRYWERLRRMFEFVRCYLKPDGTAPLIGDSDDGRVIIWKTRLPIDHSYLLPIAAVLFEDEDFKRESWLCEEGLWLFGESGIEIFNDLPRTNKQARSQAFPRGGIYIQRERDLYAIIDCGDNGIYGRGSHGHNDLLSFELYADHRTFLIDPGTYVYTADRDWRNRFRSTCYHNGVMVDGEEINHIDERAIFALAADAEAKVNVWQSNTRYDLFDGEHNAYARLSNPVVHRRVMRFDALEGFWLLTDKFSGRGAHRFDFFFNFDVGLDVQLFSDGVVIAGDEGATALALIPLQRAQLKREIVERFVSRVYGCKERSQGVVFSIEAAVPFENSFLLIPYKRGDEGKLERICSTDFSVATE